MFRLHVWLLVGLVELSSLAATQAQQPAAYGPGFASPAIKIEAAPRAGFHHPYLLLLPPSVKPNAPVIVLLPTPPTSSDPADFLGAAERMLRNAAPFLGQLESPLVVPVIPRPPVQLPRGTINLYLPALSREALLTDDSTLARIDRQVLAMVDDARRRVASERSVRTSPRAVFVGFSAGGHFATRMAVLHPQRVLAVWAGGTGGHPILPVAQLEGRLLTYPVGVADLKELTGKEFDAAAFSQVAILIAQGSADANSSLPSGEGPSDSYSNEQAQLVFDILGTTTSERLRTVEKVYEKASSRAEIRLYPDVDHRITPEMAHDIVRFIRELMEPGGAETRDAAYP